MKDPVGYLHLEGVDGACQIGVDQLRLVDESFKIGLYRLVDVGQVFFDSPDQILGAQIRGGDDGDGGLQFLIEMLLVAGGGASQVPNGARENPMPRIGTIYTLLMSSASTAPTANRISDSRLTAS